MRFSAGPRKDFLVSPSASKSSGQTWQDLPVAVLRSRWGRSAHAAREAGVADVVLRGVLDGAVAILAHPDGARGGHLLLAEVADDVRLALSLEQAREEAPYVRAARLQLQQPSVLGALRRALFGGHPPEQAAADALGPHRALCDAPLHRIADALEVQGTWQRVGLAGPGLRAPWSPPGMKTGRARAPHRLAVGGAVVPQEPDLRRPHLVRDPRERALEVVRCGVHAVVPVLVFEELRLPREDEPVLAVAEVHPHRAPASRAPRHAALLEAL
mmetsp:Transcript_87461/g.271778  ORF Transcript_87461/g.271778 Transcript_87461/m.271778 type:complete len:271 (+) Transcript_87461:150-962(+)